MFHIGQKVVCVDASARKDGVGVPLRRGGVYIIAGLGHPDCNGDIGLLLQGIQQPSENGFTDAFRSSRFRPIVERKTDISIFTAMLDKAPQHQREVA